MSDNLPYCLIQGNPDIAGIGIRASIYIQASLGPLCVLYFGGLPSIEAAVASNGGIADATTADVKQGKLLDEISLALLLTGTALITSTIIEAKTTDSGLSPYHTLIVLNLSWLNNVTGFILRLLSFIIQMDFKLEINLQKFVRAFWAFTLHCVIMSILGIWFWVNPNSFSPISDDHHPCIPITYFWIFSRIPLPNDRLRIISLIAYSAIGIPIVNIIIYIFPWISWALVNVIDFKLESIWQIGIWFSAFLVILIGPTIFFITSTEMLIAVNAEFVDHAIEEKWTFGQTLAIFLAAVSVFLTLGHIRRQQREARNEERKQSGKEIIKAAMGVAQVLLATHGRTVKAQTILMPDEVPQRV